MPEQWFEPEELTEMSRPTMDRAIEAIEAGDLEAAKRLCGEMKHEWLMLHDLMAESILGLITFVQDKLGDEGVAEAWEVNCEQGWRRHHKAIESMDRRQIVHLLAATWRAHSGSGVGEHPGSFTITEDDEKVTFTMNPAGRASGWCARGCTSEMATGARRRRTTGPMGARTSPSTAPTARS